jgi:hypothetical protein
MVATLLEQAPVVLHPLPAPMRFGILGAAADLNVFRISTDLLYCRQRTLMQ